jgi:hypothetical protein
MANSLLTGTNFTQQDFMRGNPEAIIAATDPRLLLLWPHGDETLGAQVGHYIYDQRRDLLETSVDYVCLNPVAASQEPAVRDTSKLPEPVDGFGVKGTDANRSYSPEGGPKSYEEHRAAWALGLIADRGYRDVLDIHTSKSDVGSCLIVSERFIEEPSAQRIINASPVDRVVVLPEVVPDPTDTSKTNRLVTLGLIGQVAQSVSVEYARPEALKSGVQKTMETVNNLLGGERQEPRPRGIYYVTKLLPKDLDFDSINNFAEHPDGFWPVLCSKDNEYRNDPTKNYSGFAATRREIVHI